MTEQSIEIMARTVWGEARGEPARGKIAVGWVIRNRAARPGWWGHDIITVCMAPRQFSCWNTDDPNARKGAAVTLDKPSFLRCYAYAAGVLAGLHYDWSNGATHYYATSISAPGWALGMSETARIGRHIFLKESNG